MLHKGVLPRYPEMVNRVSIEEEYGMYHIFHEGDIAYLRHCENLELNGKEVIVLQGLTERRVRDDFSGEETIETAYLVALTEPAEHHQASYAPAIHQLTLKKGPDDAWDGNHVVSWDECAWRPSDIEEHA